MAKPTTTVDLRPLLLRAREAAALLGVGETQIEQWRRAGLLTPVRLPGGEPDSKIRAIRYARSEVEALARRWCAAAGVCE